MKTTSRKIKILAIGLILGLFISSFNGCEQTVQVCHNGHQISVPESSLRVHLSHGDQQGSCMFPN